MFRTFSFHQQPSAHLKQEYSTATSRPIWEKSNNLHSGRGFAGNNRFFYFWHFTKEQVKNRWAFILNTAMSSLNIRASSVLDHGNQN